MAFRATRLDDGTALAYLRDVTERHLAADALAASEARFRSYVEMAPDGVIVVSPEGRFLDWNPATTAMLGRSDEQIRSLQALEAFVPDDRERVAADIERLFGGEVVEGEYRLLRADGVVSWALIRASRLSDGTGLAYVRDITARRHIEEAVHESEARLKGIIDSAMDGIVSIDEEQRIVVLNPAAERMFGTHLGEVRGQPVAVLLPEEKREGHTRQVEAFARGVILRRQIVAQTQVFGRRASGELFPIEASISQVRIGERKPFTAVIRDISGRLKAQEALRESDERFRQLADNVREVFWLSDLATDVVIYVSPAYETVWGRPCASLYATPTDWAEAIHPEDRARVLAARGRQALGTYDEVYRILRPDGSVRWIRDQAVPVRDPDGRVIRIAGVAEDVTERRELESQLRQTQKMESIGLLAGGVAHDFNNLLTVIGGNTELLLADLPPNGEPHGLAAEIQAAGERAASLTRQLLAFSRQQVLEPQVLDLNAVVTDTEKMLRRLVGEDIVLTTHLATGNARVNLDPGHLAQVIMNLAVNARDAMPRGGRLVISTSAVERSAAYAERHPKVKPGRYVVLSVADTGSGMTAEVRERVFEPFFTTKSAGRGTGLGLAVVHGIVEQSGGHLELDSEVGVGSTFRLCFPAVIESIAARIDGQAESGTRGTETILMVEDEETVRRLGERVLKSYGYRVLTAVDGRHALEVLAATRLPIDILVTDVVMPNMDGRELSDRLRTQQPTLKVLYTSGYTDDAVIRHGVDHAEVAFLQKPYTPLVLVRKVRDLLDRS
ncbi:MAG: PAS domain S-box protein [Deltaproteobacteria bacterium]|nr:PAS domain S-box protein [Deltaproteobacteria bacterium]